MKGYRDWNPRQMSLLPLDPMEWLPRDHLVHFLLDVVEELDLSAIEGAIQAKDHRGKRPFPPRMMVGLLLYGYCVRIFSSRKLEMATHEDLGFRVLCGGNHPDHCTINTFRKTYLPELAALFLQVLRMCQEAGLVKVGHVALDGTKMQGNASKHKAMSYSVMKRKEEELTAEIEELLKNAEAADAAEDERYGKDTRGDELPEELQRRERVGFRRFARHAKYLRPKQPQLTRSTSESWQRSQPARPRHQMLTNGRRRRNGLPGARRKPRRAPLALSRRQRSESRTRPRKQLP